MEHFGLLPVKKVRLVFFFFLFACFVLFFFACFFFTHDASHSAQYFHTATSSAMLPRFVLKIAVSSGEQVQLEPDPARCVLPPR